MLSLADELSVVAGLLRKCIEQNASTAMDQEDYADRYQGLLKRYETASERHKLLEQQREERMNKAIQIGGFLFELMERDQPLEAFDDHLWLVTIDKVIAYHDGRLVFKFQNGLEVAA